MTKYKLRDLIIKSVDLVDKGANPDANIVLLKRDDSDDANTIRQAKIGEFKKIVDDIVNLMEGDDTMPKLEEILSKLTEEEKGVMDAELKKGTDAITKAAELEKIKDEADAKDTTIADLTKKLEEATKPEGEQKGTEDILKSADPGVKAYVEGLQADVKKAADQAKESSDKVEKLQASIQTEEFTKKASEYQGLTIKPEDFGAVLMDIFNKAPESYEKLVEVLKSADKAIVEGNLMKTAGADGEGELKDSEQQMELKAKEIQKRDSIPYEQAYTKACEENTDLYAKIKKGE